MCESESEQFQYSVVDPMKRGTFTVYQLEIFRKLQDFILDTEYLAYRFVTEMDGQD